MAATLEALPAAIRGARDYAAHARARLDPQAWSYFDDHAGSGLTRRANRRAWDCVRLVPRVLRAVSQVDTRVQLLGRSLPTPLLVAPMALQRLAHADGELGSVLAAASQGAGFIAGMQSSVPLQRIAAAVRDDEGRGPLWFQLVLLQDRAATLALVRQAEAAGYEALVLTVDATMRAPRPLVLPQGVHAVHLPADVAFHPAPGWDDVAWIQSATRLPVLLKGVLHPADAAHCERMGLAGVIVSNHGGRVLDGAVATADALPRIVEAVDGRLPVLVDGGIVQGTDVLKALALGASAVLLGRPVLHGLAAAGAAGAAHVLRLIRDELQLAMAQCGASAVADLTPELLFPAFP
jgi:4-hydroxymandelate oxidase